MINRYLLIFTLAIPLFCSAQFDEIDEATVQIHSDNDGRFSNLETLNKNFEGVRVVTLGEQTHFDGATFDAKIQLVKYLHEKLGYNILAFESGYFDCSKAAELLAQRKSKGILKEAVFGVWDNQSLAELEEYILYTQKTAAPLIVTGFDSQFSGSLSKKYLPGDLSAFLKDISASKIMKDPDWINFESALQRQIKYSNFYKKPSATDTLLIGKFARKISDFISNNANAANQKENEFWLKVVSNLSNDSKRRYSNENFRDSIMAENLLSLVEQRFKNEKIICWGATSHFIYNQKSVNSKEYETFIPMGDYLHQKLNKNLFTIGFTSYKGKAGSIITHKLNEPPKESYEGQLGKKGYAYAFTSFRKTLANEKIDADIKSRILGNRFQSMDLNHVIGGIFYIETAYPPRMN